MSNPKRNLEIAYLENRLEEVCKEISCIKEEIARIFKFLFLDAMTECPYSKQNGYSREVKKVADAEAHLAVYIEQLEQLTAEKDTAFEVLFNHAMTSARNVEDDTRLESIIQNYVRQTQSIEVFRFSIDVSRHLATLGIERTEQLVDHLLDELTKRPRYRHKHTRSVLRYLKLSSFQITPAC